MDLVFVYGDRVALDREGRIYIGTSFSQKVFDRYLEHFDHLILMMRRAGVNPDDRETLSGMNRIEDPRIRAVFMPDTTASLKNFADPGVRIRIRKILEEYICPERAVILRTHSYYSYVAAGICVRKKIPYLAEAVGCPWDALFHHSLKGRLLAPFAAAQMRFCMRHASYAMYVTRDFLQKRYPAGGISVSVSDAELLPLDREVLEKRKERIRALETEPSRRLRIGTAGDVQVAYKGQRFVLQALAGLKRKGICSFEYRLAGGGDRKGLESLAVRLGIEDMVVFEGLMPHEKIYDWLDYLDLYIQPSQVEGLSRALLEAMSRGLPAFGSDVGGNPELLDPSCLHRCGDAGEIERQLEALTPERMLVLAEKSFCRAGDYEKDLLENRRRKFLARFAADLSSQQDRKIGRQGEKT